MGGGIRLGLHHVTGIADAEAAAIEAARRQGGRFSSLEDFVRRTGVSRPTCENLVRVGALDSLAPQGRRALLWRIEELWATGSGRSSRNGAARVDDPQQELALDVLPESVPLAGLRDFTDAEKVRAELEVLGMDVTRHLVTFYEQECRGLGVVPAAKLRDRQNGEMVTVAGVKVATQTPAIRSGRRIIFLTVDDPSGLVDVTIFPTVQARCARPAFDGFVLAIRGKLRRTGPEGRGVSVVASEIWDLQRTGVTASEKPLDRDGPPRHIWHRSPGSPGGARPGTPA